MSASAPPPGVRRILLVGGTSEIGLAIVRRLAADGPIWTYLLGRDRERLEAALGDLADAGCADGDAGIVDALDTGAHEQAVGEAFARAGAFEVVVLAVGVLTSTDGLEAAADEVLDMLRVNFVGCASLLLACLRAQQAAGGGSLVVLSSVAGARVRKSNPFYGASKAALDGLSQGLGDAAAGSSVHMLVVRPGFVHTRMTAGRAPAPFASTPEAVADATVLGLARRADTVWVPGAIRWLFTLLRVLPRPWFRRLPL